MNIDNMDSFVYWYTQNIIHIIQFVSVCIGLVFIYFVYRVFFTSSETASDGEDLRSVVTREQIADLDKKISKMMNQSQMKSSEFTGEANEYEASAKALAAAGAAAASTGEAHSSDSHLIISQIQTEMELLRKELQSSNEMLSAKNAELSAVKEKLMEQQKTVHSESVGTASASASIEDPSLRAKIDELEKKLQEFDIISEDIAELQNLRAENAELKSKASAG